MCYLYTKIMWSGSSIYLHCDLHLLDDLMNVLFVFSAFLFWHHSTHFSPAKLFPIFNDKFIISCKIAFAKSIALSQILPQSKTIKNNEKLSLFGENDSRRLSNFLQTHIFWKFYHISRIYSQINYRNIWFAKVIIILIMTAQVIFFHVFSKKDPHLKAVERIKRLFPLKIEQYVTQLLITH